MSKYIIITKERALELNGTRKGVNIFYAGEIYSGTHVGKFACSENAKSDFPEHFTGSERAVELNNDIFVLSEKEQLTREIQTRQTRIAEIDEEERIR